MKDSELRGLVLKRFYELRRRGPFQWAELTEKELDPAFLEPVGADLFRICEQLSQQGLIEWDSFYENGQPCGGHGQISVYGADVVEGSEKTPIAIAF